MKRLFILAAIIPAFLQARVLLPGQTPEPLRGEFSETAFFDKEKALSKAYIELSAMPMGEWPPRSPWYLGHHATVAGKLEIGRDVNEDGELGLEEVALRINLATGELWVDPRTYLAQINYYDYRIQQYTNGLPTLERSKTGMRIKIYPETLTYIIGAVSGNPEFSDFIPSNWNCFRLTLNGPVIGPVRAAGGWSGDGTRIILR